jgi:pilus assembly protein CpaE
VLSSVLITDDAHLADFLRRLAGTSNVLSLARVLGFSSNNHEIARACNALGPDIVVIDNEDPVRAFVVAEALAMSSPTVARLGVMPADLRRTVDRAAAQVWLPRDFSLGDLDEAARQAMARRDRVANSTRSNRVFLFLPAKAGSGASTVAMHVAEAMANQMGKKTLYIDSDLRSGVSAIHLDINPEIGLRDALAQSSQGESTTWLAKAAAVGNLNLVCSRHEQEGPLPQWSDYYHLLEVARRNYDMMVFDLPELLNNATAEAAHAAERLLLVTTSEVVALKLAALRLVEIAKRGVPANRVSLVVNRYQRGDLSTSEIEKLLGVPVAATIPNDYRAVQAAILGGKFVPPRSPIGKAFADLAGKLARGQVLTAHTSVWRRLVG